MLLLCRGISATATTFSSTTLTALSCVHRRRATRLTAHRTRPGTSGRTDPAAAAKTSGQRRPCRGTCRCGFPWRAAAVLPRLLLQVVSHRCTVAAESLRGPARRRNVMPKWVGEPSWNRKVHATTKRAMSTEELYVNIPNLPFAPIAMKSYSNEYHIRL